MQPIFRPSHQLLTHGYDVWHEHDLSHWGKRMIRKLILAATLFSTPAMAAEPRAFDMFGLSTSTAYSGSVTFAGQPCAIKASGIERCAETFSTDPEKQTKIGTTSFFNLYAVFNGGHFYRIAGGTVVGAYDDLKAAFTAKYGAPTSVDRAPWKNLMGAELENETLRWQFSDGTLELTKRSGRSDATEFAFLANRNLPESLMKKDQPVNF